MSWDEVTYKKKLKRKTKPADDKRSGQMKELLAERKKGESIIY